MVKVRVRGQGIHCVNGALEQHTPVCLWFVMAKCNLENNMLLEELAQSFLSNFVGVSISVCGLI